jgi:hypothetical protein
MPGFSKINFRSGAEQDQPGVIRPYLATWLPADLEAPGYSLNGPYQVELAGSAPFDLEMGTFLKINLGGGVGPAPGSGGARR